MVSKPILTEEDYINILKWWSATSILVEAGTREAFSKEELDTIEKIMGLNDSWAD